jgi:hypothetical protein
MIVMRIAITPSLNAFSRSVDTPQFTAVAASEVTRGLASSKLKQGALGFSAEAQSFSVGVRR